jgi:hypothetical protein
VLHRQAHAHLEQLVLHAPACVHTQMRARLSAALI